MILFRFDFDKHSPEELQVFVNGVKEMMHEDVIAVPNDVDVLFNCATDYLIYLRDKIDNIIKQKDESDENRKKHN